MPFMTTAALVGAGIAGSLGGAAIASHGASNAAKAQSNAGLTAAQLQAKSASDALAFQKQEYADQQKNIAPYLQAGQGAVGKLSDLVKNGGLPSWNQQFQAPNNVTEQNDPGFQFRLQQGEQALQRSAAAKGGLLSGGTAKALTDYGQQAASNEYGNVYNRALGQYQQSYNEYQQNQANTYNRLAGLAGTGQTAAGQLASAGQSTAGNVSNILLGSAAQQGSDIQNAAAARASGYAGGANAYGGAVGGIGNSIQQQILLSQLGMFGGGGTNPTTGGV
jgi:hypothetical protein